MVGACGCRASQRFRVWWNRSAHAVRLRAVGPGALVADAEALDGGRVASAPVGSAVVGQDPLDPDPERRELGGGGLEPVRGARRGLVRHRHDDQVAARVVDDDLEVRVPGVAVPVVRCVEAPQAPPAAAVGDAAELLVVLVEERARVAGDVPHGRRGRPCGTSRSRLNPRRLRTRCTVEGGSPSSGPRRSGPYRHSARAARISASCAALRRRGDRCGRELRSARPASPSARYRRTHLYAVARLIPSCSATCAAGQPSAARVTRSRRPKAVSFDLGCATRALSSVGASDTPNGARGLSCCQQRVWGLQLELAGLRVARGSPDRLRPAARQQGQPVSP